MSKLTNEEFIQKMLLKYGDAYSFDKTDYVNARTPVIITCKKHGDFCKKPMLLLRGYGCNKCSEEYQKSKIGSAERKLDYANRTKKRRDTVLAKYGVSNVMKLNSIKNKVKNTCLQKYGVDNPRKLQSVVDKARKTNIERYGNISYLKTKAGLEHVQHTNLKKYGADNFIINKCKTHYL